jgi:hypothetical protein
MLRRLIKISKYRAVIVVGGFTIFTLGCHMTNSKSVEVVWKGTKEYENRIGSFNIKPNQALDLAVAEMNKPGSLKLSGGLFGEELFLVGRYYWFGIATKTEICVRGYYVHGDTGEVSFRESDKIINKGDSKIPD